MIWLNGDMRPAENAVSANDRGLLLGEAVFETMLVENRHIAFWDAHLARLMAACSVFGFDCRYSDAALANAAQQLMDAQDDGSDQELGQNRLALRLTVTGGHGGRGLVPSAPSESNWLMHLSPAPAAPQGLMLHIGDVLRLAGSPLTAHKTGNYLDNIIARRAALAVGADEAVMLNQFGRVACTAAGTIYLKRGPLLLTPPLSEGALPGIIRGQVLQHGGLADLTCQEALIEPDMLRTADALFVSNSLIGVVPAHMQGGSDITEGQKKQGAALCTALSKFA